MTTHHPLATRADERSKADAPNREAERAQLLWELDAARELFTTDELRSLVTEARRIVARRP